MKCRAWTVSRVKPARESTAPLPFSGVGKRLPAASPIARRGDGSGPPNFPVHAGHRQELRCGPRWLEPVHLRPKYGSLENEGWGILNERYLLGLLLEYAATLGMIDVALIPPEGARRDFRNMWGSDGLPYFSRYDGLMYFRLTLLGCYCLGVDSDYQRPAVEVKAVLRVLPNLEIAATGSGLEQSDRLALGAYANPVSEFVWRLEPGKLLAAIEAGRQVEEIREFLKARSGEELPGTVSRLLDDVAERTTKIHDAGLARLVECADSALAALIANDSRTRKHCMRAGDRHLVVAASAEAAFRRGLRDAGYLFSPSEKSRQA